MNICISACAFFEATASAFDAFFGGESFRELQEEERLRQRCNQILSDAEFVKSNIETEDALFPPYL